jgi:hypothetical protein
LSFSAFPFVGFLPSAAVFFQRALASLAGRLHDLTQSQGQARHGKHWKRVMERPIKQFFESFVCHAASFLFSANV